MRPRGSVMVARQVAAADACVEVEVAGQVDRAQAHPCAATLHADPPVLDAPGRIQREVGADARAPAEQVQCIVRQPGVDSPQVGHVGVLEDQARTRRFAEIVERARSRQFDAQVPPVHQRLVERAERGDLVTIE